MSAGPANPDLPGQTSQHQQDALGAAQVAAAAAQEAADAARGAASAAQQALAPETVLAGPGSHTRVQVPSAIVEVEINLAETVRKIIRGRWLILATTLTGLLLSIPYALSIPPFFVSEAVFLPPKPSNAPTALIIGGADPSDLYLALVASRSVQDDVIDRLGLMQALHFKDRTTARLTLATMTSATVTRNSLIDVKVTTGDAELSAKVANSYLDALYDLNGRMVASASGHRRRFFEQQLEEAKNALADAETALARTQKQTGVSPSTAVQLGYSQTAGLEGQINAAEARLAGLLASDTEENPEVKTARRELAQLRAELVRQQSDQRGGGASGLPSNNALPELSLEYARRERELKLRESVFNNLVEQYESAREASIDPGPQLQVVDRAIPAEKKSGPSRRKIVTTGTIAGFALGLAWLLLNGPLWRLLGFFREAARSDPKPARRPAAAARS